MLNGQISDPGYATHLTQVASYFDIVDNAVKTADTNKRYSISTNVSTAPSPPISENSWTHVHIAPTCDNMCDLYNSYITAELEIDFDVSQVSSTTDVTFDETTMDNHPSIWVGYKDAMQAISQYQIISNGVSIYDQSHSIEEAYITGLATPDTVIDRDVFTKTSLKGIHQRPDCLMTGALIDLTNKNPHKVKIQLKIDIRRFLPLASVKYLPAFVGNLELRLKFSTDGLVCAAMPYTDLMTDPGKIAHITTIDKISTCFVPLGDAVKAYYSSTKSGTDYTVKAKDFLITRKTFSVTKCNSILCCFGIDDGIYQSLIQRYSGQSLSFPTQTLSFHQMDGKLEATAKNAADGKYQTESFNLAITITPRFIDTIFFLFPQRPNHKTCYYNPLFEDVRLYMGGYGTMPDQSMTSFGMMAYEMVQNALNLNTDTFGINEGVMRSQIVMHDAKMKAQTQGYTANDISNYILAFPTSTDNTFQQGQTSSSPITYELKGTINSNSLIHKDENAQCVPMIGFLKDSVLAIQIRPTGPPIIAIDEFDIASPSGA